MQPHTIVLLVSVSASLTVAAASSAQPTAVSVEPGYDPAETAEQIGIQSQRLDAALAAVGGGLDIQAFLEGIAPDADLVSQVDGVVTSFGLVLPMTDRAHADAVGLGRLLGAALDARTRDTGAVRALAEQCTAQQRDASRTAQRLDADIARNLGSGREALAEELLVQANTHRREAEDARRCAEQARSHLVDIESQLGELRAQLDDVTATTATLADLQSEQRSELVLLRRAARHALTTDQWRQALVRSSERQAAIRLVADDLRTQTRELSGRIHELSVPEARPTRRILDDYRPSPGVKSTTAITH